jgi:methyl-accepting chemotaxis protein
MSATSEELASQAEQLQAAISYFRIDESMRGNDNHADAAMRKPAKSDVAHLRAAVMANAPHMARKAAAPRPNSGGFALDLDEGGDDLDAEFTRRGAA